jgi:hypothetical protein
MAQLGGNIKDQNGERNGGKGGNLGAELGKRKAKRALNLAVSMEERFRSNLFPAFLTVSSFPLQRSSATTDNLIKSRVMIFI